MVLVIVALASGLVAVRLGAVDKTRAEARKVASTLRLARAQAVAQGSPCSFVLDLRHRLYGACTGKRYLLPPELGVTVKTVREKAVDGAASIIFFPDGSSTGGGVLLSQGKRRLWVGVEWLTGEISVAQEKRPG